MASAFISDKFDFDHRNTFLLVGLARVMVAVILRRVAAYGHSLRLYSLFVLEAMVYL